MESTQLRISSPSACQKGEIQSALTGYTDTNNASLQRWSDWIQTRDWYGTTMFNFTVILMYFKFLDKPLGLYVVTKDSPLNDDCCMQFSPPSYSSVVCCLWSLGCSQTQNCVEDTEMCLLIQQPVPIPFAERE